MNNNGNDNRQTGQDLAECQKTEQVNFRFLLRLQSLIESTDEGIYALDANGGITLFNRAASEMTGWQAEEVMGKNIHFFIHHTKPDGSPYPKEECPILKVLQKEKDVNVDTEVFWRRDGTSFPVEYYAHPTFENGTIASVAVTFRNISKRKQVEEELLKERDISQSTINNLPGVFYLFDTNGKFIRWNRNLEEITGYTSEEISGMHPLDFFVPEERQNVADAIGKVFIEGKASIETIGSTKSGHKLDFFFSSSLIIINKIPYLIGVGIDISKRKQAEEALQHERDQIANLNDRLQEHVRALAESNANLEQFAFIASHDLRDPLSIIAGYTQLLKERLEGKIDPEVDNYINSIIKDAGRMERMINSLLELSRISTRGQPLKSTDMNSVLKAALVHLEERIKENQAEITNDTLPTVLADEIQLIHVFQNLIGNAIKYRREETPEIHVSARYEGNEWVFSVADNGIGIEEKFYDKLFKLFQRVGKESDVTGSGIGLAIVEKIIKRHHGRVWVQSEPGVGSTFYFTLPDRRF